MMRVTKMMSDGLVTAQQVTQPMHNGSVTTPQARKNQRLTTRTKAHCDLRWMRALLRGRKGRLLATTITALILHLDILPAVASTHFKPAAARITAPSLPPVPLKARLKTWLAAVLPWQRMQEIPPLAPAPGLPPAWGASASVYGGVVNLGNGNLTLQVPLVNWANGLSFVLFFNSQANAADPSPVAPKWTHNWYVTLTLNPNQTQATLREGDGSRWIYTDTDRDGVFTSPAGVFDRLVRRSDGRYVLTRKGSEEHWVFSLRQQEQGPDVRRLEQVIDRYGNAIQLRYTGGQLTTIRDRYDRTLTLLYSNNRLWKVRDFIGREWELVYTPTGRLWKVRYPVVLDTSREPFEERVYEIGFGYNSRGNVISWTDRLGNTWQYEYLSATSDVLKRFTDPAGHKWTASYFLPVATPVGGDVPEAGSSRWTDPTGRWVEYGFDKTATVARITQGSDTTTLRLTTRFWYNEQNLLIKKQDPAGLVWEWSYDSQGNLLWSKEPNGARTEYSYYPGTDHVWKIKDALGNEWEYTYTRYGDVDSVVDPEKAETSFEYDYELGEPAYGHLRQVIDPMKRMTEYVYYAADDANLARRGQLRQIIVPGGFWRKQDYGGAGWLTRREVQTANGSEVTTYTYDNWGRLRLIDYPRSADVSMGWDGESRRVWVQDGVGRREYTYDAWGRITRQQGCCGGEESIEVVAVTAEYDEAGRKRYERELNSSGAAIRTIETTYDALGRLQTIGDYRGRVVYSYEETTGRLRRESYPNGSYVEYTYYDARHPSQVGFVWQVDHKRQDGSLLVGYEYTYDLLGRVVQSVERPSGDTTEYAYTPAGRLERESRTGQVWYWRNYSYNPDGSRLEVTRDDALNGQHWEIYFYDEESGRLQSVLDLWTGEVTEFAWNPEGTLARWWRRQPNGYVRAFRYDEEGRVVRIEREHRNGDVAVVSEYGYTGDGVQAWKRDVLYEQEYRYLCRVGCGGVPMRVYSRVIGGSQWASVEDYLPAEHALGYNRNWRFEHSGGELLMMGPTGVPSGYYPKDSNGLSVGTQPPMACLCVIMVQGVCTPIAEGSCSGDCEDSPPLLPPDPPGLPKPGLPPGYGDFIVPLFVRIPIYGNWCGLGHPGPGAVHGNCTPGTANPPPIDELDACCCKHDKCYDIHNCNNLICWRFKCACLRCDLNLARCALRANCRTSPNPAACERWKKIIAAAMAAAATRGCLF